MDGAGKGKNIYAGCAVYEEQACDFFEGRARVEEVVNKQDLFACYVIV
jgi:hypothetical protein